MARSGGWTSQCNRFDVSHSASSAIGPWLVRADASGAKPGWGIMVKSNLHTRADAIAWVERELKREVAGATLFEERKGE